MHAGHGDQIRTTGGVELVEIGFGLEIVGVDAALGQLGVRLNIIVEHLDLYREPFSRHSRLDELQDLGMRYGRRPHDQRRRSVGGRLRPLSAGGERQRGGGKDQGASKHGRSQVIKISGARP